MERKCLNILLMATGLLGALGIVEHQEKRRLEAEKRISDKYHVYWMIMNQWVKVRQKNKSMAEFLARKGYKEIAIYGMNIMGEALLNDLADSEVTVRYGIDKEIICADVEMFSPEADLPKVDAVIVTPVMSFGEINKMICEKVDCPILSIEDILYEM